MTVLNKNERLLLEKGYDNLALYEKNNVIVTIAEKLGIEFKEVTDEVILQYHKDIKLPILSDACEDEIVKGFKSANGHIYRTNRDDQINMIGQKDLLNHDETVTAVMWKTEDEGYIEHTREEWLNIYFEAFMSKQTKLFKYNDLKKSVLASTTHNELLLINWS